MAEDLSGFARGLQRVVQPTDSLSFREDFQSDPVGALAAKGLILSADEQTRLNAEVADIVANQKALGGEAAATEVEVSVKVKF